MKRNLGMGVVLAIAVEDPFPGNTTEWSWVLNSLGEGRTMWYRRNGLSLRRQNDDYWKFLVPETGKAPVIEFCVLITLFAMVIGPLNYFLLLRQRRLYLLLATIPTGAALVTFALIGYAMITDGLGTQVRVRSYTKIDQQAGRAVDWSRQSYYAGIAPSRGLNFPQDVAVLPFDQFPHHEYDHNWERQRTVAWEEGQNLRSGFINSRITAQFVTMQVQESSAGLLMDKAASPPSARNQLGGRIKLLLLRDAEGDFYSAENIAAGEKFSLTKSEFASPRAAIHKAILAERPNEPEGLDPSDFGRWNNRGWFGWNIIDNGLSAPQTAYSLMEDRIRRVQSSRERDFPKQSYGAILETSVQTPLGVDSSEVGSLHVVEGSY